MGARRAGLGGRVAVAAAAALFLADEPTSHQDAEHAALVLTALRSCAEAGSAVLVASHEELVRAAADQVVDLDEEVVLAGPPSSLDAGEAGA